MLLLRSNQKKDKVMQNNSQVKIKQTEVEDHHRISSFSNKIKSVTACNDSLKSRTSNVKAVCATCGKYMFNSNHDACVSKFINDVNTRTKNPNIESISARKPTRKVNQSVATPHKKIVALESTIQKSRSYIVQIILFIVDSGCTKHMTGNLNLLCNFVEKYLGTVRLGNDQFAPILRNRDLVQGNITIKRETTYLHVIMDLISTQYHFQEHLHQLQSTSWQRRHQLKHDYGIDQLCSFCELGKEKRSTFKTKTIPSSKGRLNLLHMDLCDPMRIESINGKRYILVIVDDYSRYT
ncbi:retrovirus-related pol polyprotein from transposon TNT 1-94 [Tanacetum coccineum]